MRQWELRLRRIKGIRTDVTVELSDREKEKKSFRESKSPPRSQMIRELSYVDAEINNYGKNHVSIQQRSMFQHAEVSLSFQIISLVLAHYRLLIKV